MSSPAEQLSSAINYTEADVSTMISPEDGKMEYPISQYHRIISGKISRYPAYVGNQIHTADTKECAEVRLSKRDQDNTLFC